MFFSIANLGVHIYQWLDFSLYIYLALAWLFFRIIGGMINKINTSSPVPHRYPIFSITTPSESCEPRGQCSLIPCPHPYMP